MAGRLDLFDFSARLWMRAYPRRWREHPRFWPWLGYRILNRRLPDRYRYWVIDDLIGPLYDLRMYLAMCPLFVWPMLVQSQVTSNSPPWEFLVALAVWSAVLMLASMALRFSARLAWSKHVGGMYPAQILPLRRRRQVRRAARSRS